MFVYRGENLKDPEYINNQRKIHYKELNEFKNKTQKRIERYKEQINAIIKDEQKAKLNTLLIKPYQQLTEEEKNELLSIAKSQNINETNIIKIRLYLSMSTTTTEMLKDMIKKEEEKVVTMEQLYNNNIVIALDRDEINETNINEIIKIINDAKNKNQTIRVCIDNVTVKSNSAGIDYMFEPKELMLLTKLDNSLKDNKFSNLSITELIKISKLEDFQYSWSLNQVIKANNKVDEYVNYIKENNLSPFEAMLYIHKIASNYTYSEGSSIHDGRVLPSIINNGQIVCSGYASLVKAIIDRVNMPGLRCDLKSCYIGKIVNIGGHTHNLVTIEDTKYDIKGTYLEDACWDCKEKEDGIPKGFAHCLYPIEDVMHFSNGTRYFDSDKNDRISNLIFDTEDYLSELGKINKNGISHFFSDLPKNIKNIFHIPKMVKIYKKESKPIVLSKYIDALTFLYTNDGFSKSEVEEKIARDIKISKEQALSSFTKRSMNVFSKILIDERKITTVGCLK